MASDWWGLAMAAGTALAQGYMAKKNVDAQKKDAQHAQDEWERAMQMQQQNIYDARNSPFAKVGMTMLDQMLHVYGDQSKGRGGFTLPVDQLSSMLGGFGSFGSVEDNRQGFSGMGGGFGGGGYTANPDSSTGWYGPGNGNPGMGYQRELSPEMRAMIEERKQMIKDARELGLPGLRQGGGGGGGMDHQIQRIAPNGMDDSRATSSGSFLFDDMFEGNYEQRLAEKGMQRGLSMDDIRAGLWEYAAMDEGTSFKDRMLGNAGQFGIRTAAGVVPVVGQGLKAGLTYADKNAATFPFMWNYDNPASMPQSQQNLQATFNRLHELGYF